jgi:D-glycero-D-manno-heptose 1,7-bisphosphate phosphatase
MSDTKSPIRSARSDGRTLHAPREGVCTPHAPREVEAALARSARRTGAFFLDRDGVIVEEVEYLAQPGQLRLLPGAAAAIARLNQLGVPVVVVTNQAGVAHGYFPEERVAEVHRQLDAMLAAECARVDRYYYCPHHPTAEVAAYRVACRCRKPAAGMLERAAAELQLDLRQSYMVGDKWSDIQAGLRAACRPILVCTGYGGSVAATLGNADLTAVVVAADLAQAVADCLPELTRQCTLHAPHEGDLARSARSTATRVITQE